MTTPSQKLRELADFIVTKEAEFDYCSYSDSCGSPRCAAGWACVLWPDKLTLAAGHPVLLADPRRTHGFGVGRAIGISDSMSGGLFYPGGWSKSLGEFAPGPQASAHEVATWIRRHADALEAA